MQVGERIGRNLFYQYFEIFGFTEKTGIDLPGEATNAGLFHTEESLNSVELATSSFGQTFKAVSYTHLDVYKRQSVMSTAM